MADSAAPPHGIRPAGGRHARGAVARTCGSTLDNRATVIMHRLNVWKDELVAWFKTLASAAVYATLIVTFGFQVARVEGLSMAPTLADQDRLIVNKFAYRIGVPRRGDIVMLYYPLNPDKSFVKRVIAEEGDQVRIVDGRVYVNDVPMQDDFVPPEYRSHDDFGPTVVPEGLLLRDGRPSEQQLRQPPLGLRAEEVHHRQGAAALVADPDRARVLTNRYTAVVRVLNRVLVLNLAVAVAKIALGLRTGAVSILSDGFHSLTDSASNVVALDRRLDRAPAAGREPPVRPSEVRNDGIARHPGVPGHRARSRCWLPPTTGSSTAARRASFPKASASWRRRSSSTSSSWSTRRAKGTG